MPQVEKEQQEETFYQDEFKEPSLYKVILYNDDYTTMDFVINILKDVFRKNPEEAKQIMLVVHNNGQAVVGIYTREIAETRANKVHKLAKKAGYPLLCTFEPI